MKKNIGIVFGGNSVEHEISILSFIQAMHAIDTEKYEVLPIYLTKTGSFGWGRILCLKTFQRNLNIMGLLFIKKRGAIHKRHRLYAVQVPKEA